MSKLIKQLPLVALLLALTVFVGKAAVQALTSSTTMWLYNPSLGDPDDETAYTEAINYQEGDCQGLSDVCAVEAPASGTQPDFDTELEEALRDGTSYDAIKYGPYNPQN